MVEKYNRAGREDRRNLILNEAFSLFIENGYNDIKMDDIAGRAGFGKSTLYEYFKSKDEIFEEVLRIRVTEPYEEFDKAIDETLAPFEKLRTYLTEERNFLRALGGTENILPIVMMHPEYFMSPIFVSACHKVMACKYRAISGYIREGTENGDFRELDPLLSASVIIGAAGSFMCTLTDPEFIRAREEKHEKPDPDEYSELFFDMIKRALT
jgi:TetR/AcrR family fatty acid metabolism transcriptional regulator